MCFANRASWSNRFTPATQAKVETFIRVQDKYLRDKSEKVPEDATDPDQVYWHHVGVVLAQFDGMLDGFNARAPADKRLRMEDLWIMNLDGDILDIERAVRYESRSKRGPMSKQEMIELIELNGHCSALVKWTGDDLLIGHTT